MPSPGDIVSRRLFGTSEVVFRYPRNGDAPALLDYINTLSRERTFIGFQGEQLTLEQEAAWLQSRLETIAAGRGVSILACEGDDVIGTAVVDCKPLAESHIGVFGIAVAAHRRGLGIGSLLMDVTIAEAERLLDGLRIIELSVFGNNPRAQRMYAEKGFVQFGQLPGGFRHRDQFVDQILMFRGVGSAPMESA